MKADGKKLKAALREGKHLKDAMIEAGYSESTAKRGKAALSKAMWRSLVKSKIDIGRSLSAQERMDMVRGAIVENIVDGKDRAVNSIKLAGQDRDLAMWQPEVSIGVIAVTIPEPKGEVLPVIEDVPLLESGE